MQTATMSVTVTVNGTERSLTVEPRRTLLDALREDLALTGTKKVCNMGTCGACTVLVDGRAMYACLMLAVDCASRDVVTIEGLSKDGQLHPLQQAWIDEQVPQCGYCQNGQILTAKVLLDRNPNPTDAEIRDGMEGALCRCMTYYRIQQAIKRVARGAPSAEESGG